MYALTRTVIFLIRHKMARLYRLGLQFLNKTILSVSNASIQKPSIFNNVFIRPLSVSPVSLLKEFREIKQDDELIIKGEFVPSPREGRVVKAPEIFEDGKALCSLCALDLDLKFTDVLILKQFLRSDGCLLPRRITKICAMQQKRIKKLVAMAQKAGLMMNIGPPGCSGDPTKRREWKKFNTYYDEKTLFMRRRPRQFDKFKRR